MAKCCALVLFVSSVQCEQLHRLKLNMVEKAIMRTAEMIPKNIEQSKEV